MPKFEPSEWICEILQDAASKGATIIINYPESEIDYYRLLKKASKGECHQAKFFGEVTGKVYSQIVVEGNYTFLNGPIVLEKIKINSSHNMGTVYVPYGIDIEIKGNNPRLDIVRLTSKELAERAGLS